MVGHCDKCQSSQPANAATKGGALQCFTRQLTAISQVTSLRDVESWIRNPELSKVTLSDAHSKIRYYSYFAGNSTVDKLLIRPNTPLDMIDSHVSVL